MDHLSKAKLTLFNTFLNDNIEEKMNPFFFQKMKEGLRTLVEDPQSQDEDAVYMRKLCQKASQEIYHYLRKHSHPDDGYLLTLEEVQRTEKNFKKAEKQAQEIYWRKHAALFLMTLIPPFGAKQINLDLFIDFLSSNT